MSSFDTLKMSLSPSPNLTVSDSNDAGVLKLSTENLGGNKAVNFGPGADLLMNPTAVKRSSTPKSDINLADLNELESININTGGNSLKDARKSLFSSSSPDSNNVKFEIKEELEKGPTETNFNNNINEKPKLGEASDPKAKTESNDGFKKFNNIPVNPDKPVPKAKPMTNEEILKEKFKLLRRFEELEKKGIKLSKKYSMDSSLQEMKGEYETLKSEREKKNSGKFQGKMLMAFCSGIEFLNGKFDPFDINLDGWAESVNENIDEYDEVFGELHEKYAGRAKIAPELKLIFMLGGSAAMLHMSNTMFKSAMPGMDDIMRQNPELMQQFTQAAVNSMEGQNPNFAGFMRGQMPMPPQGSPPMPNYEDRRDPPKMPDMGPRPDFAVGRNAMFDDAENMEGRFQEINESPPKTKRVEMKGPTDLKDILSGLKTKKVNLKSDANSTVSVHEIDELNGTDLSSKPKKSKRKPKSERNTITLQL